MSHSIFLFSINLLKTWSPSASLTSSLFSVSTIASSRLPGRDSIPRAPVRLRSSQRCLLQPARELVVFFNALQPCGKHYCKGKIRIAGRIRPAQLDARGLFLAGFIHGYPYQGRTVAARPGDIDRRLIAGNQPLVGVYPLVERLRRSPGHALRCRQYRICLSAER